MKSKLKNRGKIIELSILVVVLLLVLSVKVFDYYSDDNRTDNVSVKHTSSSSEGTLEDVTTEAVKIEAKTVQVHIKGEVLIPGVYELEEDSRVNDVVKLAGGFTKDADESHVNLAAKIYDTQQIKIYKIGETPEVATVRPIGSWTLQDLNEADAAQLKEISGIGDSMAEKIITYRESNGPFNELDELINVSGIGEKKLESIKLAFESH